MAFVLCIHLGFADIFESISVPDAINSPSPVPCSMAINAPVLVSARLITASTISFTFLFLCS